MAQPAETAEPQMLSITVERGRHKGAALMLPEGSYTLGNSVDTDIVLTDLDVLRSHARLDYRASGVRVVAVDGDVNVVDRGLVQKGFSAELLGEMDIALGDATLHLKVPKIRADKRRLALSGRVRIAAMTCFVLIPALLVLSQQVWQIEDARAQIGGSTSLPERVTLTSPPPRETVTPKAGARIGIDDLKQRLVRAGFDSLAVTERAGALSIAGALPKSRRASWNALRSELDAAFPGAVLQTKRLVFLADPDNAPRPPVIDAVWVTKSPFVVIGGRKHIAGSSVGKAWRIETIEKDKVTFLHRGRKVAVRLRGLETKQERTHGQGQYE